MGLTGGKHFIKIIFDIKIEISILEILDVPNFDKFWAFLILDLTGGKYCIKSIFDIMWAINNWLYADELLYLSKLF